MHLHNATERAISTFKDNFIARICSIDPDFPMKNWDLFLEQAEITLNLLYLSIINTKISVYAQLNGTFNYNIT